MFSQSGTSLINTHSLGLLEHIYDRMRKDREEISRQLALDKSSDNFNRLPELKYAWTVLPLPKGNRLQGFVSCSCLSNDALTKSPFLRMPQVHGTQAQLHPAGHFLERAS